MASVIKVLNLSRSIYNVGNLLNRLHISQPLLTNAVKTCLAPLSCRNISTTSPKLDLMEFFDHEKNWGENEVKVGRAWRLEELRIKSNEDLHKLWFVLLKERNMLLTMEEESKDRVKLFPNPERIDKIKESMENLESVVRERNEAYFLLETGESGERPGKLVSNALGLKFFYRMRQHIMPKYMNTKWRATHQFYYKGAAVRKFLKLYREKLWNAKRKQRNRDNNHVMHLMKRFPNLDLEAVKEQFPNVDIEKLKDNKKTRGHFVPK